MISNNLILLSQNIRTATRFYKKGNEKNISNPCKNTLKYKFQHRIKESHDNLFNFINDSYMK